jgi:hypothetical protein
MERYVNERKKAEDHIFSFKIAVNILLCVNPLLPIMAYLCEPLKQGDYVKMAVKINSTVFDKENSHKSHMMS